MYFQISQGGGLNGKGYDLFPGRLPCKPIQKIIFGTAAYYVQLFILLSGGFFQFLKCRFIGLRKAAVSAAEIVTDGRKTVVGGFNGPYSAFLDFNVDYAAGMSSDDYNNYGFSVRCLKD